MRTVKRPLELPSVLKLDGSLHRFPEGLKTDSYTHTLHRFPGKFVPQVADELIDIVIKGTKNSNLPILDPFCGCGTTNIQAAVRGVQSIGVDFDPLGVFISQIKSTILTPKEIKELKEFWSEPLPDKYSRHWVPPIENLTHWFTDECINQLSYLKNRCMKLNSENTRRYSLGVLSAIIRRVSKADDQTQKTYVSGTLKKIPPLPKDLFPVFMSRAVLGISSYSEACLAEPIIHRDDARVLKNVKKIRGVVTSPPYLDSIDYIYNQMLEYYWLYEELGLPSPLAIKQLRKEPMGFVRCDIDSEIAKIKKLSPQVAKKISSYTFEILKTSKKEAEHVTSFFTDFLDHLLITKQKMMAGGIYTMVIGESVVRGHTIPTPEILKGLFEALDFEYVGGCAYEIRRHYMKFPRRGNSGKIKVDHILCFKH